MPTVMTSLSFQDLTVICMVKCSREDDAQLVKKFPTSYDKLLFISTCLAEGPLIFHNATWQAAASSLCDCHAGMPLLVSSPGLLINQIHTDCHGRVVSIPASNFGRQKFKSASTGRLS
jgi:hypothetical protein